MINFLRASLCLLGMLFFSNFIYADTITIYTEEFPPFNFTENGKMTGMSTEIVDIIMKQAALPYIIESYPWARTYQNALERPNALIYSMSRLTNRENLFKWIGSIAPTNYSVFALKKRKNINIKSFEEMKKYKIGTTLGDAREIFLVNKGLDIEKFDRIAGSDANVQNYKKLKLKRIDLWPMPDAVADYVVKKIGDNPDVILKKVFALTELSSDGYFLAANLQTPDEIVNRIKSSLEEFKKTQEYQNILNKWGAVNKISIPKKAIKKQVRNR